MDKILFVDDDPNILNAFKRKLSGSYEFVTSTSPTEAVQLLQTKAPISIVISDMHMPGMPGSEFLKEVARKSPDTIRVMLTGLADQRTAVRAINEGSVFRFLNKPCSIEDLENVLKDCISQRKLIQQEKDLLQNTLGGVLALINDLLSFIDPEGVQRASRVRKILREISKVTPVPLLELELATMLRGLGKLSLPLELLLKNAQGEELTEIEKSLMYKSQQTSARLIRQIPRLEKVSFMIEMLTGASIANSKSDLAAIQALRFAEKIAEHELNSESLLSTVSRIEETLTVDEKNIAALFSGKLDSIVSTESVSGYSISLAELFPGQKLIEDLKDKNGKLLLKKGFLISTAVIERIRNHSELVGLDGQLWVNERIPTR